MASPDRAGLEPAAAAGAAPRCMVFPDGDDWIVFGPRSLVALRVNARAAARFRDLPDPGSVRPARSHPDLDDFVPSCVTIACTNRCEQRCVYCYGTPAHRNPAVIDLEFCAAGLDLAAQRAVARGERLRIIFHGVGEPTFAWRRFTECVDAARDAAQRHGVTAHLDLCTGGQVSAGRAGWIASRFDSVQVSIDGPADIQNRQRPRADGRDSLAGPLRLARTAAAVGRRVCVKATVTAATVGRMVELVEFVAREIGQVRLDLGMMFDPPWVSPERATTPPWRAFVAGFSAALDRGTELGVAVRHPSINWDTLGGERGARLAPHFCLAPPNVVTSFFDVPREGDATPEFGAYGRYDRAAGAIVFDHAKRRRLEEEESHEVCRKCACGAACLGAGGVKGRMPRETPVLGPVCQARLGVLRELLRRAVPPRPGAPTDGRKELRA